MKNHDKTIENLIKYTEMSEVELIEYLVEITTITDGENYFYIDGGNREVCLVCHIDTVRSVLSGVNIKRREGSGKPNHGTNNTELYNLHGIAGFDDRAGVTAGIELAAKHDIPILFFNYEETGGLGSRQFCYDFIDTDMFDDTRLFIELDRQGTDFVEYHNNGGDIMNWVRSFDLVEGKGSFSDVAVLTDMFRIPSINVGIGYHNEHTNEEYLNVAEYLRQVAVVSRMIENIESLPFKRLADDSIYTWGSFSYNSGGAAPISGYGYDDFADDAHMDDYIFDCHTEDNSDEELWAYFYARMRHAIRDTVKEIGTNYYTDDLLIIAESISMDEEFKQLVKRHTKDYFSAY